jgi:hypothetical protein
MSINNSKSERRKKASISWSCNAGVFIITSILLAGGGFALIGSATTSTTTAFGQEENNNTTTASTPSTAITTSDTPSGIQLSAQPVMQEQTTTTSTTPINQTHMSATFSGNGTLTLPGTTDTINYTTNGTALVSLVTHTVQAKETLMTELGETATATIYEIAKFDPSTAGEGKGLTMALIDAGSTGTIASLNGTIVAGISDMQPNGQTSVTFWEWESGIDNNTSTATSPT